MTVARWYGGDNDQGGRCLTVQLSGSKYLILRYDLDSPHFLMHSIKDSKMNVTTQVLFLISLFG